MNTGIRSLVPSALKHTRLSVFEEQAHHSGEAGDFHERLEKPSAKSPREMIQRQRMRSINSGLKSTELVRGIA